MSGISGVDSPGHCYPVAGLFAGVGGIELGLSRAGHHATMLCEVDPGAKAVLEARFPGVPVHSDIRDLSTIPAGVRVLAAGFPCQDLSQAGKTKGIRGVNSGLVGHVFRLLDRERVPWVLLENVPFMLQLAGGQALEVVVAALEELGYRWAYRVVDSRAFGVPQRRQRVYLVASLEEDPRSVLFADETEERPEDVADRSGVHPGHSFGFYWTEGVRGLGWAVDAIPTLKGGSTVGVPSPPALLLPDGRVVKPALEDAERLQGFEAGWTGPAGSVVRESFRWKLVGNAVSVPAAQWIGRRLASPGESRVPVARRLHPGRSWPHVAWNVDGERMTGHLSRWPVRMPVTPVHEFLQHEPVPLSPRATRGFLARAAKGSLRFPRGFLEAVQAHLDEVENRTEVEGGKAVG